MNSFLRFASLSAGLLSLILFTPACDESAADSGLPQPPLSDAITAERIQGGGLVISCEVVGAAGADKTSLEFARNIKFMRLLLRDDNQAVLDTLSVNPIADAGVWSKGKTPDTLRLHDEIHWSNPHNVPFSTLVAELQVEHVDGQWYAISRTLDLPPAKSDEFYAGLDLRPMIESQTDSSATFTLLTQRRRKINNEHFPTEETLRVEILDGDEVVWSSNHQQHYDPVYSAVEPIQMSGFHRYALDWDGMTNDGAPLAPGEYTVRMTLPVEPVAYVGNASLNWKNK